MRQAVVEQMTLHWKEVPLRRAGEYDVERALARVRRTRADVPTPLSHPLRDGLDVLPTAPARRNGYGIRSFGRSLGSTSWNAGRTALAVAGVASVAIVGTLLLNRMSASAAPGSQAAEWREYTTGRGQLAEISLGDGSSVWLGPATSLRVSEGYGVKQRMVMLDGQAMFTVTHDERKPFLVRTPRTVIEDLGTTFIVSDYRGDRTMQVAVASGVVDLRQSGHIVTGDSADFSPRRASITMERGDVAQVDSAGVMTLRSGVDVAQYASWTRRVLTFNRTPLRDAVDALNRFYDADVQLRDPELGKELITAKLNTESLTQALQVLQIVLDVHVERHGTTVTLGRNR